jgi:succinate-semialdehyde dehydrogenase/glutarate-semialdehyde dehydrogenase
MSIQSINPYTNQVLCTFDPYSAEEVEFKLKIANTAFSEWRFTEVKVRAKVVERAAAILTEKRDHFAQLITSEMGKPIKEARAEVEKCATACLFYAEHGPGFLEPELMKTEAQKSYVRYDALGTVLAIMPWNFPFWQVIRFAAPAILAGNTGLLKHASNVPQCALAIEELFREAGAPEGVFQTLLIGPESVNQLISDARIVAVTLTGSEQAGSQVAQTAGKHLKKTVLELGGSDTFIVLKEADVETAAKVAAQSRMINTGQSCIAAKRFIVERAVSEQFTEAMKGHFTALLFGEPSNPETDFGPLARPDLAETLRKQVTDSAAKGAKILWQATEHPKIKSYFPPTILTNVTPGMPAFDEETFGPIAAITVAENAEEAIRLANLSDFGLGASLWTKDLDQAEKLAARLEAGSVFINAMVKSDPRLPFGGIKRSGYGRELAAIGMREFMNLKTVWVQASEVTHEAVTHQTE